MGTFHDGKGELHGMTVVVDLKDSRLFVGRCDTVTPQGVVLLDADWHDEDEAGPGGERLTKADYLRKASRVGFWKKLDRVVVPTDDVKSIRKLAEIA